MIKDLQCCLLNPFNNFSSHSDVSLAFKGIDVYEVVFEATFDLRSNVASNPASDPRREEIWPRVTPLR